MLSYFRFIWNNSLFRYFLYLNILLNCLLLLPEAPTSENSKIKILHSVCGHLRLFNNEEHKSEISSVFLLVGTLNPQNEIQIKGFSKEASENLKKLNARIFGYISDNVPTNSLFQFSSSPRAPPIKA